jgi:hypothetical protein
MVPVPNLAYVSKVKSLFLGICLGLAALTLASCGDGIGHIPGLAPSEDYYPSKSMEPIEITASTPKIKGQPGRPHPNDLIIRIPRAYVLAIENYSRWWPKSRDGTSTPPTYKDLPKAVRATGYIKLLIDNATGEPLTRSKNWPNRESMLIANLNYSWNDDRDYNARGNMSETGLGGPLGGKYERAKSPSLSTFREFRHYNYSSGTEIYFSSDYSPFLSYIDCSPRGYPHYFCYYHFVPNDRVVIRAQMLDFRFVEDREYLSKAIRALKTAICDSIVCD